MTKRYPLIIENVGDDTFMLLSRGHHNIHEFMKTIRLQGFDWSLGVPLHVWLKAVPNRETGGSTYHHCDPETLGAFPATFVSEASGREQYQNMVMWTGRNLREVIEFTGKCSQFDEWFRLCRKYCSKSDNAGHQIQLICE
ncbi:hypothetical protein L1D61_27365 [Vibrio mediterranei]|uniref:Uncharacterized protein n=1 Tax=Vibrio mediterranei TaxID=689 RepID=A0A3G4VL76_9VIBR|nr:hypothetical protein [Vibrio mediterranei]AYV24959.1 hypothetical protein ECB94_26915 [Vibrio mediterranei]MCG9790835.1 hypothetical protein [Vibrio mediterranei]